ncbi:MAG: hypothetical protein HW421_28 [Ignavibacteria bacterium]|nr:hypothetical protein [Ignavibacteria bacterium]
MNEEISSSTDTKKMLWDLQDGEPLNTYSVFEFYLSLGMTRSYKKAADFFNLTKQTVYNYAKRWNWQERVALHDRLHAELRKNDYLLELEKRREETDKIKMDLTLYASRALTEVSNIYRDYWAFYNNPDTAAKLKFLDKINRTIDKIIKYIDMPISGSLSNAKSKRDININCLLELREDIKQIETESDFAYQNLMNENEVKRLPLLISQVRNNPEKLPDNWKSEIEKMENE